MLVHWGWGLRVPKTFVHIDLAELSNFQLLFLSITLFLLFAMKQILIEHANSWYKANEYETEL